MKLDIDAQAAKAVALLEGLNNAPVEGTPVGSETAPHGTLKFSGGEVSTAAGIAFIFSKKAGLGLSVSHGSGFVIARIPGKPGWSAPLPFHVTTSGLGVTIGYSEVETVLILDTQEAVLEFLKTQVSLDSHLSFAVGSKLGADASETALDIRSPGQSFKRFSYSVSKGVMIDASWNGAGISVKDEEVQQLYGGTEAGGSATAGQQAVKRADVLSGAVPAPGSLTALYGALNRLAFFADNQEPLPPETSA